MEKQTFIIAIIVISFIAGSCNKEDESEQLPPITQTGANTFGFVFDGVVFTPTDSNSRGFGIDGGGTSGISIGGAHFESEHYSNKIMAHRYTNIKNVRVINLYLYKLYTEGIGTYYLGNYYVLDGYKEPYNSYISMFAISPNTGELTSYYSYENSGEINITRKDEGNIYIFSGTFSGKLKSQDGEEIIEIANGRFDIDLNTIHD